MKSYDSILISIVFLSILIFTGACSASRLNPAKSISETRTRSGFDKIKEGDRLEYISYKNSERLYIYSKVEPRVKNDTLYIYSRNTRSPLKIIPLQEIDEFGVTSDNDLKNFLIGFLIFLIPVTIILFLSCS